MILDVSSEIAVPMPDLADCTAFHVVSVLDELLFTGLRSVSVLD